MTESGRQVRVLFLGGTSQVGVFALPRLLEAGHEVLALSRRIESATSATAQAYPGQLTWLNPGESAERNHLLQPMQIMVSCGPVKLAARLLDSCLELRRVICISTSSIFTKTASSDSQEQELIKNIISDEKKLKSSCEKRNIELLLLRPTLIYGCGLDKNISRLALLIKRFGFIPLAGKASGMRQPVHADDLAKLVMAAINKIDLPSFESPVSGGTTLSYRDMVNRVFDALDQPSKILSLPPAILIRLLKVLTWIPGMGDMNAEFVLRQNRDMVFDDSRLREILGATAQPFQPTTSDFEIPKRAGSLQPR